MKRVVGIVIVRILLIPRIPGFVGVGTTASHLALAFFTVAATMVELSRSTVRASSSSHRLSFFPIGKSAECRCADLIEKSLK